MRKEAQINQNWYFTKAAQDDIPKNPSGWEKINLPHTWNAYDGQDGGSDYDRGEYWYFKETDIPCICSDKLYYIEFGGAASSCKLYINGRYVCCHLGGYSKFRADITSYLSVGKNIISLLVSNKPEAYIYPQMADFTFFGGVHRGVKLIEVDKTHFDLDYFGGDGIAAYSFVHDDGGAQLHIKGFLSGAEEGDTVKYMLFDREGASVFEIFCGADDPKTQIELDYIKPWQGVKNPYLYKISGEIIRNNEVLDRVCIPHGFRSFYVDSEKGFFLNGESMPLRGVSRHGDKLGRGIALTYEDHKRDAELISECGANTVRLAHYQHDEDFYDLCDSCGFVVWAEIPFISKMNEDRGAHENAKNQLRELICQNFNHPSICFWGISNEITIGGNTPSLVKNLRELNDIVHEMDKTRISTMAQVSMLPMDDEQNLLTDVLAYNHYFGWYSGKLSDNEEWLDAFHKKYPERGLGLSEYGCEGIIKYHTKDPHAGDYSEEYQALYHEHMLRVISERDWIWGSYVWNMFDFGCDARDEGGVRGRNNKGLVTYDRAVKKDSFYICKAYWSEKPFVHICSKRYFARSGDSTGIKVYSNCDSITLTVNGEKLKTQSGKYVYEFTDIPLRYGENTIAVRSGACCDMTVICRVDKEPEGYVLREEESAVANWFDIADDTPPELTFKDGFYSVEHSIEEILGSDEAGDVLLSMLVAVSGMKIKKTMLMMMASQTPKMMILGSVGANVPPKDIEKLLRQLNAELQKIAVRKERGRG